MRKKRPTYDLDAFKSAMTAPGKLAITVTARNDAYDLGFTQNKIVSTIRLIGKDNFSHSITSHENSQEWQDVYYMPVGEIVLYVKFGADLVTEFKILSFKEK